MLLYLKGTTDHFITFSESLLFALHQPCITEKIRTADFVEMRSWPNERLKKAKS
jgi:hypothetical protein